MKLSLLVFNEAITYHVIMERYDYEAIRLTPRYARRASVMTKLIPCWVTDGSRIYRVTRSLIRIVELADLRHRNATTILHWQNNGKHIPDYFLQVK